MKLSTDALKEMISKWVGQPEMTQQLEHYTDEFEQWNYTDAEKQQYIDETAHDFGCRGGCSYAELREHIKKIWCDGSKWKREEKRRLKDSWEEYLTDYDHSQVFEPGAPVRLRPSFRIDTIGECDQDLVKKYFDDRKQAQKCILRVFSPPGQLADNYRLEVVTTPEDDAVIGWTVIQD